MQHEKLLLEDGSTLYTPRRRPSRQGCLQKIAQYKFYILLAQILITIAAIMIYFNFNGIIPIIYNSYYTEPANLSETTLLPTEPSTDLGLKFTELLQSTEFLEEPTTELTESISLFPESSQTIAIDGVDNGDGTYSDYNITIIGNTFNITNNN